MGFSRRPNEELRRKPKRRGAGAARLDDEDGRGRAGFWDRVDRRRHSRPSDREGGAAARSFAVQPKPGPRAGPPRRPSPDRRRAAPSLVGPSGRRRRADKPCRLRAALQALVGSAGSGPGAQAVADALSPRVTAPAGPLKPGARATADAQLKFAFSPRGEWAMPPLAVLAEPKKSAARQDLQRRARAERPHARRRARRFRRQGRDRQRPPRPGRDALRARARARHQVVARHRPRRRHRPLDVGDLGARRGRAGPQRHRHRAAEPAPRDGLSARAPRERGFREVEAPAGDRARQDDRRRAGDRRPRPHAASAGRRHHRLGQVGRDQHHDPVAALSAEAGAVPADHGRSEDARAFGL